MTNPSPRASELVAQERDQLANLDHGYPANHFAWKVVRDRARERGATSLVEIGVGAGNGVAHVLDAGMTFAGIDNDEACVTATQSALVSLGHDPAAVIHADIEVPSTLTGLTHAGEFDALMALGIMPHVDDAEAVVRTMESLVRPGGDMFLEFRNSLFSLVTFNRLTRQFIVDDLLENVSDATRERVGAFVDERVDLARPPLSAHGSEPHYANPLAMVEWCENLGFTDVSVHPFHYHAAMPVLEQEDPQAFRDESIALESDSSGWRGLFLCSVFLLRATRPT